MKVSGAYKYKSSACFPFFIKICFFSVEFEASKRIELCHLYMIGSFSPAMNNVGIFTFLISFIGFILFLFREDKENLIDVQRLYSNFLNVGTNAFGLSTLFSILSKSVGALTKINLSTLLFLEQ